MVQLGKEASTSATENGAAEELADALSEALEEAESLYDSGEGGDEQYYKAIRALRDAIRNLRGLVPQADNHYLNLFRQGGSF